MAKFNEKEIQIRDNAVKAIIAFLEKSGDKWEKLDSQRAGEDEYRVNGEDFTVSWLMQEYEGMVAW